MTWQLTPDDCRQAGDMLIRCKFRISAILISLLCSGSVLGSQSGIPGYSLNATGSASCHACHTAPTSAPTNTLTLIGSAVVTTGSTNSFMLRLNAPYNQTVPFAGFDLSASNGVLLPADSQTKLANNELVHGAPKATTNTGIDYQVEWSFNWKAPANPGVSTLNACALPVNGDGLAIDNSHHGGGGGGGGMGGGGHSSSTDGYTICTLINVQVLQPPTANAGLNQTVMENSGAVSLDGTASSDDGSIVSYAWQQLSGVSVTLNNNNVSQPSFTAPVNVVSIEELVFQLTVTDNDNLTNTSTVSVFIQDSAISNLPPVANAGPDQMVDENTLAVLDGSASTDPEDTTPTIYVWEQIAGPTVTLDITNKISPSFTAPLVGIDNAVLTFKLIVVDSVGVQSSDTVNVLVNNVNQPPVAVISDAAGNSVSAVPNGGRITLYGNFSSDVDGPITAYSWSQVAGAPITIIGGSTNSSLTFDAPDALNTDIEIQLAVTGDLGIQTTTKVTLTLRDLITFQSYNNYSMIMSVNSVDNTTSVSLSQVYTYSSSINTDTLNRPDNFPYELVNFEININNPDPNIPTQVLMTLYLPVAATESMNFYQYLTTEGWINNTAARDFNNLKFENGAWTETSEPAKFNADRTQVLIYVTDGGPSDEDGVVNGVILYTGGIGEKQENTEQSGATGRLNLWMLILLAVVPLMCRRTVEFN